MSKLKIGVYTVCDLSDIYWQAFFDFTCKNTSEYCIRQGYDFHVFTSRDESRHPSWSKIFHAKKILPYYDWIFCMDADSVITNHTKRLEDYLNTDKSFITTFDDNKICAATYFIKNDEFNRKFLDTLYNYPNASSFPQHEQSVMNILFYDCPEKDYYNQHIELHRYDTMNSSIQAHMGSFKIRNETQEHDFIYHALACPSHAKLNVHIPHILANNLILK